MGAGLFADNLISRPWRGLPANGDLTLTWDGQDKTLAVSHPKLGCETAPTSQSSMIFFSHECTALCQTLVFFGSLEQGLQDRSSFVTIKICHSSLLTSQWCNTIIWEFFTLKIYKFYVNLILDASKPFEPFCFKLF